MTDDRIAQMQEFLWELPHWADQERIEFGTIERNREAATGTGKSNEQGRAQAR